MFAQPGAVPDQVLQQREHQGKNQKHPCIDGKDEKYERRHDGNAGTAWRAACHEERHERAAKGNADGNCATQHHAEADQVGNIKAAGRCMKREMRCAEAALFMLEFLDALVCERYQHVQRDQRQERQQQIDKVGAFGRAAKAEANATIAGVIQLELQAFPHQPWKSQHENCQHGEAGRGRKLKCQVVTAEQHYRDNASFQDRDRIAVIFKTRTGQPGIVVKIAHPTHLGPRRVNAQSHNRQQ